MIVVVLRNSENEEKGSMGIRAKCSKPHSPFLYSSSLRRFKASSDCHLPLELPVHIETIFKGNE
jgi:hypothetical protein